MPQTTTNQTAREERAAARYAMSRLLQQYGAIALLRGLEDVLAAGEGEEWNAVRLIVAKAAADVEAVR